VHEINQKKNTEGPRQTANVRNGYTAECQEARGRPTRWELANKEKTNPPEETPELQDETVYVRKKEGKLWHSKERNNGGMRDYAAGLCWNEEKSGKP